MDAQFISAALTFPDIDPVIFGIGPVKLRWYGLGYVVGILFAWIYGRFLLRRDHLWKGDKAPMAPNKLDDFVIWSIIGIVLGGRIGYVCFYYPSFYFSHPQNIIAVWDGGLSFHGGFIGVCLAMILFAKRYNIVPWSLFDLIAAGAPIGIGVVRICNFINSELWGRVSDVPWAVRFPNGGFDKNGELLARHPSQLYEAFLEGFMLFVLLTIAIFAFKALRKPGMVSGLFVAIYAVSRIIVEFFREPDAQLGYLLGGFFTMGMLLSLPMLLLGLWMIWRSQNKNKA